MHHNHNTQCQHEFKYCLACDIVYCEKCQSEWWRKSGQSYQWPGKTTAVPIHTPLQFAELHIHEATNPANL